LHGVVQYILIDFEGLEREATVTQDVFIADSLFKLVNREGTLLHWMQSQNFSFSRMFSNLILESSSNLK